VNIPLRSVSSPVFKASFSPRCIDKMVKGLKMMRDKARGGECEKEN
jgi:hypothetical protein